MTLDDDICNKALHHLEIILNKHGRQLDQFPNMPIPTALLNDDQQDNYLIRKEKQYNIEELAQLTEDGSLRLNGDQRTVYEKVIAAIETKTPAIFLWMVLLELKKHSCISKNNRLIINYYMHSNYLIIIYSTLFEKVCLNGYIALTVASSGIQLLLFFCQVAEQLLPIQTSF
jgi:hypothetical protein